MIGTDSKSETERLLKIGDVAIFNSSFRRVGDKIIFKSLKDRVCCGILIDLIKEIEEIETTLYFAFISEGGAGLENLKTVARQINPDVVLVLDCKSVNNIENNPNMPSLGKEPIFNLIDEKVFCHPKIITTFRDITEKYDLPIQYVINKSNSYPKGKNSLFNDKGSGRVSVPCCYNDSPFETIHLRDIEKTKELVKLFLSEV